MKIDIPFEIGHEVFVVSRRTTETIKCPKCDGKGYTGHWQDEWSDDHYTNCKDCGGRDNVDWPHGSGHIIRNLCIPVWEEIKPNFIKTVTGFGVRKSGLTVFFRGKSKVKHFFSYMDYLDIEEIDAEYVFATRGKMNQALKRRNAKEVRALEQVRK